MLCINFKDLVNIVNRKENMKVKQDGEKKPVLFRAKKKIRANFCQYPFISFSEIIRSLPSFFAYLLIKYSEKS